MSCTVYKNICSKLRAKPKTLQVGLTSLGGEKSNFMGYLNSDSLILMRFYLMLTTFLATAIGRTQNNPELRVKAHTEREALFFITCSGCKTTKHLILINNPRLHINIRADSTTGLSLVRVLHLEGWQLPHSLNILHVVSLKHKSQGCLLHLKSGALYCCCLYRYGN